MFDILLQQIPQFLTWQNAEFFGRAMMTTLFMAVLGCGTGFLLGFLVVIIRRIHNPLFLPLRVIMIAYVEIFRRIPFLVLLFLVLFVSKGLGVDISLFTVACVSIVVVSTAFIAEIVRAGLDSVHPTQADTATAMNFSQIQILWYVVLPQAWKVILPPAFAFFVMFIKDTALASQVGVLELTQAGKYFNNLGYSALLSFGTILVLYFILSYPLTYLGWWIEARMKSSRQRRPETVSMTAQAAYELRQS
jgi:polar amino acid transport system permease protein